MQALAPLKINSPESQENAGSSCGAKISLLNANTGDIRVEYPKIDVAKQKSEWTNDKAEQVRKVRDELRAARRQTTVELSKESRHLILASKPNSEPSVEQKGVDSKPRRSSPSKPRWSVPIREIWDSERLSAQEAIFQQQQEKRRELVAADTVNIERRERAHALGRQKANMAWWERDKLYPQNQQGIVMRPKSKVASPTLEENRRRHSDSSGNSPSKMPKQFVDSDMRKLGRPFSAGSRLEKGQNCDVQIAKLRIGKRSADPWKATLLQMLSALESSKPRSTYSTSDNELDFDEFRRLIRRGVTSQLDGKEMRVSGISEEVVGDKKLKEFFMSLDTDRDGIINVDALRSTLVASKVTSEIRSSGPELNKGEFEINQRNGAKSSQLFKEWMVRTRAQEKQTEGGDGWEHVAAWENKRSPGSVGSPVSAGTPPEAPRGASNRETHARQSQDGHEAALACHDPRADIEAEMLVWGDGGCKDGAAAEGDGDDGDKLVSEAASRPPLQPLEVLPVKMNQDVRGHAELQVARIPAQFIPSSPFKAQPIQNAYALPGHDHLSQESTALQAAARGLDVGDYAAAHRLCSRVIDEGRATAGCFYIRGEACRLQGHVSGAVDDLGFCLALDPTNARAHLSRGLCLVEMHRYVQAATHFKLALDARVQVSPSQEAMALVGLGRCYQELGDVRAALVQFDLAVEADKFSGYAFFCRGRCRRQGGDAAGAAQDMALAVARDPQFVDRYVTKAAEAERQGDLRAADELYKALEENLVLTDPQRALVTAARRRLRSQL